MCACYPGYILRTDRRSCKAVGAPMYLVYSTAREIRRLTPAINTLELLYGESDGDGPRITGLDVAVHSAHVYFALEDAGSVHRISLDTHARDYVVGVGRPQRLAVDWLTDNVYFVDAQGK